MIKVVYPLRKRSDMNFEEFRDYYENHHSGLVTLFPTAHRYIRRYARDWADEAGNLAEPDFHVLTEVWFEDQAAFDAAVERAGDPVVIAALREDEAKLFDTSRLRSFIVDERETPLT